MLLSVGMQISLSAPRPNVAPSRPTAKLGASLPSATVVNFNMTWDSAPGAGGAASSGGLSARRHTANTQSARAEGGAGGEPSRWGIPGMGCGVSVPRRTRIATDDKRQHSAARRSANNGDPRLEVGEAGAAECSTQRAPELPPNQTKPSDTRSGEGAPAPQHRHTKRRLLGLLHLLRQAERRSTTVGICMAPGPSTALRARPDDPTSHKTFSLGVRSRGENGDGKTRGVVAKSATARALAATDEYYWADWYRYAVGRIFLGRSRHSQEKR